MTTLPGRAGAGPVSFLSLMFRRSFRDRGFATLFIVTLALGVGANAALLSALRGYLVRPLPYRDAGRLVVTEWRVPKLFSETYPASIPIYEFAKAQGNVFSNAAYVETAEATVVTGGRSRSVHAARATASLFPTLGMHPFLGRFFSADADRPDGPAVAVVSFQFWQSALHADRAAIGRVVVINGVQRRIVGVLKPRAFFPNRNIAVYLPREITQADMAPASVTEARGMLVARLAPGVRPADLASQLGRLSRRFLDTLPAALGGYLEKAGFAFTGDSLRTFLYGDTANRLGLIELGALVLLALAVVNLMNLTLVRTLRRRHEIALRLALGANRRALLGLALSETVPLGFVSWIAAVGIAYGGVAALRLFGVGASGTAFSIGIDPLIVLVGLAIALTGTALAVLPLVLAPRRTLLARLIEGPRGTASRGANRVQRLLSIVQIAFAVALLVNAAMLGITLNNLSRLEPGFDPHGLVVAQLALQGPEYEKRDAAIHFAQGLLTKTEALPGVQSAALSNEMSGFPFGGALASSPFTAGAGNENGSMHSKNAYVLPTRGPLIQTLGLKLLRGQDLRDSDSPNAVLIDQRFAHQLFGTTAVVGKTIVSTAGGKQLTVKGVVANVLWGPPPTTPHNGTVIRGYSVGDVRHPILLVRTQAPLPTIASELRASLHRLAPDQSFSRIATMQGLMSESLAPLAAPASLYAAFGLIALLLAAVGVYGVIAYRVRLRLPEFAVRQSLGATPLRIVLLALAEGGWVAAIGIACGLAGGWWLHYLTGRVGTAAAPELAPNLATAGIMAAVILLAALVPALRARRGDLVALLRPQ